MPNLHTKAHVSDPFVKGCQRSCTEVSRTEPINIIHTTRMKGCPSREVPENCSSGEVENPLDTGHDIILMPNNVEAVVQPSDALPHSGLIHALGTASIREIQKWLLKVLL